MRDGWFLITSGMVGVGMALFPQWTQALAFDGSWDALIYVDDTRPDQRGLHHRRGRDGSRPMEESTSARCSLHPAGAHDGAAM